MGIAEGMKSIAENIIASYDVRVKALKDLVSDTRKTIKGFAADRKKMSEEQAKELANFVSDLSKTIGNMVKGFQNNLKEVSKNRAVMSEELRKKLASDAKDLSTYVKKTLKEHKAARAGVRDELRKNLARYVKEMVGNVKVILGDADKLMESYRSDIRKAGATWRGMASTLAKAKKEGVMTRIEAGEKVTTGEAPSKRKKRGRPRKKR